MKTNGESINGVLPPSVLGTGITVIKKLLQVKFTHDLGGGGLSGGEVDIKISPVNVDGKMCGTA
jgi:hypothetical protein